MRISDKRSAGRRFLLRAAVIILMGTVGFSASAKAQTPAKDGRLYVVTHVDSVPNDAASATKLLQQYVADTRKDKGVVRCEVYVQESRTNHFSIVEVWADRASYDAHIAAAHTKEFREKIHPMLGSPFDERLHSLLE
jgi:quinol monooxygenase YgiN